MPAQSCQVIETEHNKNSRKQSHRKRAIISHQLKKKHNKPGGPATPVVWAMLEPATSTDTTFNGNRNDRFSAKRTESELVGAVVVAEHASIVLATARQASAHHEHGFVGCRRTSHRQLICTSRMVRDPRLLQHRLSTLSDQNTQHTSLEPPKAGTQVMVFSFVPVFWCCLVV